MNTAADQLKLFLRNQQVLVTGGTGSIGREIVASLLKHGARKIVIFNKDDSKQYLLKQTYAGLPHVHFLLGDIRDYERVEFATRGMDLIFHAAALKQVPICEEHPFEAVKTNVLGSEHIIRASIVNQVHKVVNISTDKAVNPTNTMGASKLLAEKLFSQANQMLHPSRTRFCSVRFGNVLGSRGSVIPLFLHQVKAHKPLTVTDSRMTRFFMSIHQAAYLTLKAALYCSGGETFILKMESLRLSDLCKAMSLFCKQEQLPEPHVQVIGVRPGEKLHEELLSVKEVRHLFEDEELYVVYPPGLQQKDSQHFKPSAIQDYRSDQIQPATPRKLLAILNQYEQQGKV
ncbi:SDR family NAD(P)-dependent oxidoreductase [Marinicrinis sediminis]|uniref:SDR family NAD(P)-dependent oxidoreductase n=1 Tax=Marinicrinis sediminis TaxID=1652465 RepID=A0ABW5R720_9BACL